MQPPFERSRLIVLHGPEDPDEGLLGEVLGVVLIAGKPVGQPVHPVGVLAYQLVPRRHGRLVPGRVENRGPLRDVRGLHPLVGGALLRVRHAGRTEKSGDNQFLRIGCATQWHFVIDGNRQLPFGIPRPTRSAIHTDTVAYRRMCGI